MLVQVWKIQLPLKVIPSDSTHVALAYRKGKENLMELDIDRELLSWFAKDEVKIYVNAKLTKKGLNIIERVAEQEW